MDRPASTMSLSVGNQAGRRCMVVSPQFLLDLDGLSQFQEPLFSVCAGLSEIRILSPDFHYLSGTNYDRSAAECARISI